MQNRVSLAVPVLPNVTKQLGISVRKETVGPVLIATLSSPAGRRGELYLCNYANREVKDQLARLPGVGRVRLIGPYPNGAPQKGGGLLEHEPPAREGFAILRGKPVAALVVSAIPGKPPRDVCAAIQAELTQLRARLPEDLALDVVFDSTPGPDAAEYLGIDVDLPDSASMDRTENLVRRCGALMAKVGGQHDVLALCEDPFRRSPPQDNRAFLLVRLAPADNGRASRESIMQAMRAELRQFPGAVLRLRDLAAPGGDYPVQLALHTTADLGVVNLQATADALVKRLSRKPGLTDVFTSFRASVPSLYFEIDREKAARLGVAVDQIEKVLRPALRSGQHRFREGPEALRALKVPDGRGQMVPLTSVVRVREVSGPTVIYRFDLGLMAEITANLAPGVSLAEARAQCEEEARTTLPKEYRLTWLSETP